MCLPTDLKGQTIQLIVTVVGSLLCINFGIMFGITPPHMALYQSVETPLNKPISADDATMIAGLFFLSAAGGALLLGLISHYIGPKSTLLLSGLLQIASWSCMHFANDILHIYSSRLFGGMAAGATFTVLPIYILEISETHSSGSLIASIEQWRSLGIFLGFLMGYYVQYFYIAVVAIGLSFAFTMMFPFSQESPYYFMRKNNVPSMEKSLRWYRGIRRLSDRNKPEFLQELNEFRSKIEQQQLQSAWTVSGSYLLRAGSTVVVLVVGTQLSGVYVILNYAKEIFDMQDFDAYPIEANVLVLAVAQLLGATITMCIWPRLRRKLLLTITALAAASCLILLALFMLYAKQLQFDAVDSAWIPLGILAAYILLINVGIYPLATLIMCEILPVQQHVVFSSVAWTLSWTLLSLCIKYFHTLVASIGLVGCIGFFAVFCIAVAIFAILLLPETYGKSLKEIQENMGYVRNPNVAKNFSDNNRQVKQRPAEA